MEKRRSNRDFTDRTGEIDYKIDTVGLHGEQKEVAELVNIIGEGLNTAVEKSVKNERLKTDLITNGPMILKHRSHQSSIM